MRALPALVVHGRVRLGGVERLVGVELVDQQEEPVVVADRLVQPAGGRGHGAGTGEVGLVPEPTSRPLVGEVDLVERRRADPAGIRSGLPRVGLVAPLVVPSQEVGVVVLPARLEQVGVVGDQHGRHAGGPQLGGDRLLPQLDRPPRLPEEVERAAQQVVASRDARQRARVVAVEADGPCREAVQVGRVELGAAVGADEVAVQAVEEDDDDVARCGRRRHDLR